MSTVPAVATSPASPGTIVGPGFRRDVQALRALAVSLVLGFHLWPGRFPGGYVGVDVFFVISGFLIVGQLVREGRTSGRVALGQFWARRACRLLPAAFTVIVLTLVAIQLWVPQDRWQSNLQQALASAFYVQNWALAAKSTDYLGAAEPPTAFQHFWSLSVEEQCYIAAPVVLGVLLVLAARRGVRAFFWFVAAMTATSLAWSISYTASNPAGAYFVTTTRVWEFGLGALLAFAGPDTLRRVPPITAWTGLAMIMLSAFCFTARTSFPGYAAMLPVLGGALVLATVRHDRLFAGLVTLRPVQVVGDASYSIYLWHWPLFVIAPFATGHRLGLAGRSVVMLLSLLLGWASMRWIELPLRVRHGRTVRLFTRPIAAIAAVLLTLLAADAVGYRILEHDRAEAKGAVAQLLHGQDPCRGAPSLRRQCPPATVLTPALGALSHDDGNRAPCWSTKRVSELHVCTLGPATGFVRDVIAVGDSHNNSLIPAYEYAANTLHWRIRLMGKNGCFLSTAPAHSDKGPAVAASCDTWRKRALEYIRGAKGVDLVLVTRYEKDDASTAPREVAGLREAWGDIVASGKKVVAVQDVPTVTQATLDCVAEHQVAAQSECRVPEAKAYARVDTLREAARGMRDVTFLPTAGDYCADGWCPPVMGGVPVYFNLSHLSKTFCTTYGPILARHLATAAP